MVMTSPGVAGMVVKELSVIVVRMVVIEGSTITVVVSTAVTVTQFELRDMMERCLQKLKSGVGCKV